MLEMLNDPLGQLKYELISQAHLLPPFFSSLNASIMNTLLHFLPLVAVWWSLGAVLEPYVMLKASMVRLTHSHLLLLEWKFHQKSFSQYLSEVARNLEI